MVTARITPFSPGASPPPVSIPTLRTSAMFVLLVRLVEKSSLANPPPGSTRSGRRPRPGDLRRALPEPQDGAQPRLEPLHRAAGRRPRPGRHPREGGRSGRGPDAPANSITIGGILLTHGTRALRLHGQHLPLAAGAGRLRERRAA